MAPGETKDNRDAGEEEDLMTGGIASLESGGGKQRKILLAQIENVPRINDDAWPAAFFHATCGSRRRRTKRRRRRRRRDLTQRKTLQPHHQKTHNPRAADPENLELVHHRHACRLASWPCINSPASPLIPPPAKAAVHGPPPCTSCAS